MEGEESLSVPEPELNLNFVWKQPLLNLYIVETVYDVGFGQNRILHNHLLLQHKAGSILECAIVCQTDSKCVSFDYKASEKTCLINAVIGSETSGDLTEDMTSVHGTPKTDAQRCYGS